MERFAPTQAECDNLSTILKTILKQFLFTAKTVAEAVKGVVWRTFPTLNNKSTYNLHLERRDCDSFITVNIFPILEVKIEAPRSEAKKGWKKPKTIAQLNLWQGFSVKLKHKKVVLLSTKNCEVKIKANPA